MSVGIDKIWLGKEEKKRKGLNSGSIFLPLKNAFSFQIQLYEFDPFYLFKST